MKNLVIIGVIVGIVLVASGFVVTNGMKNQNVTDAMLEEKQKQQIELQPSLTPAPTQEPLYSVEIDSFPTFNSYGFTYKATLKNMHATPFITNFGFYECNFRDSDGNKYSGSMSDNNVFEKAILPNESREFVAKDINVNISEIGRTTEGFQKCSYNEKGENVCKSINDIQIIDCIGYISTDGKRAGGAHGGAVASQFPIKIVFPVP